MVYNGILMETIGISVMVSIGLLLFFFSRMMYTNPLHLFVCFCHYDCPLLKIQPSFPELVCNYKFCTNNNKKKIRGTGARSPHSISDSALPSMVFLCICNVCTKETSGSFWKIPPLEKTVDFIFKNVKYYYLKNKITPECIAILPQHLQ